MTTEAQQQQTVDSDASFEAGFNRTRGDTTPAEPAKQDKPEVKASDASTVESPAASAPGADPATTVVEDEWKDVPPKVKAELESMRGMVADLTKLPERFRAIEHQVGGIKSLTQSLKETIAKATTTTQAAGHETPTQEQIESAAKDEARWKQLTEDFPEWAEAIDARLKRIEAIKPASVDTSALKTEVLTDVDSRIAKERDESRKTILNEARVLGRIDAAFPDYDWEAAISTEQFATWYGTQKPEVQSLSASPKPQDAIRLISLFRESEAKAAKAAAEKESREKRLDRAEQPQGVAHEATPSTPTEDESFERGFKRARAGA